MWNFESNAVSFFSSESPNYKQIVSYDHGGYKSINKYSKNNDGTISVQHK